MSTTNSQTEEAPDRQKNSRQTEEAPGRQKKLPTHRRSSGKSETSEG
jgi:hypothetical protein